jgi:hypothetical protein
MYETVVYIEVVAVDVYLWCLVVVVPCQDQMTSRARRPAQYLAPRPNRVFTIEIESFEHVTTLPLLCCDTNTLILHLHFRRLPSSNDTCLRKWSLRLSKSQACASRHFFLSFFTPHHQHGDSDHDLTHKYLIRALEGRRKHGLQTRAQGSFIQGLPHTSNAPPLHKRDYWCSCSLLHRRSPIVRWQPILEILPTRPPWNPHVAAVHICPERLHCSPCELASR